MEESVDELGKGLAATFANRFKINGTLAGIAQAQAELQHKLRPYQTIIDAARPNIRMAELSGIMGIAQALREQSDKWNKDYSGILGISRAIQEQTKALRPGLTFAAELARTLPKNLIGGFPDKYTTSIASIARQHQDLFQSSNRMMPFLSSPIASQLTSMQIAMNGISGSIAKLVAQNGQWDLMDDFESASAQAMELSDQMADEFELSEETEHSFHTLVAFVVSFIKRNKKVGLYALRFVEVVIMIAAIHQYYNFLLPKPEMATKEDMKKMESRLVKAVVLELKKENEFRVTDRICHVYLKPRTKSQVLFTLPAGTDISILQMNHKWVYVSFTDPLDHYPQTGWILKKYLK